MSTNNKNTIPNILFEDDEVLVVNKPAGLLVHGDDRSTEPTLVDWLVEKYPSIRGVVDTSKVNGDPPTVLGAPRSGIVHRIDRETSGTLLVAKTQRAFDFLKKQFQKREVEKIYHAFVYGRMNTPSGEDEGVIDRPIARSKRNPMLWSATRGRKGKERDAVTEYKVLQRAGDYSLVELRPLTGRTHQLRVHLKAINYPVVCDKLYAPARECPPERPESSGRAGALGFSRLALHARSLSFALPSGKNIKIEAPYPEDFKKALAEFEIKK